MEKYEPLFIIIKENILGWAFWIMLSIGLILNIHDKIIPLRTIGVVMLFLTSVRIYTTLKKNYLIHFKTSKDDFKSKGERIIANYFKQKGIKYLYEKPVGKGVNSLKPDFYLPEFEIYVEYWGRWSTDFEYRKTRRAKLKEYDQLAIDLVEIFPDNIVNLDWVFTKRLLNKLKDN